MDWDDLVAQAKKEGYKNVVVPGGDYDAEATGATFQRKAGKKDNVWVKWKILNGPHAGEVVSDNMYIDLTNPKLMNVFRSKCTGAGLDDAFFKDLKSRFGDIGDRHFEEICKSLPGQRSKLKVTVEEYQGKPNNKVFPQEPLAPAGPVTTMSAPTVTEPNPYSAPATDLPI